MVVMGYIKLGFTVGFRLDVKPFLTETLKSVKPFLVFRCHTYNPNVPD
jgi:hypothetical protein